MCTCAHGDRKSESESTLSDTHESHGRTIGGLHLQDIRCINGAKAKELTEELKN